MRLLFDQNLSFKLVRLLADVYPDSAHVRDSGLLEADDAAIWRYAAERELVIVSKDSDFHQMSLLHGHPPKTVWLRVGNAPTSTIRRCSGSITLPCGTSTQIRTPHSSRWRRDRSSLVSTRTQRPWATTSPTSSPSSRSPTAPRPSSAPAKRG